MNSIEPIEFKTRGYDDQPLYTIVYEYDKNNNLLSYQRLYQKSFRQMEKILKDLNHFYENYPAVGGRQKIHFSRLSKLTGIGATTLRELLAKMAGCKSILSRTSKEYKEVYKGPLVLLQQKTKNITLAKRGKKTCLYIMPKNIRYFGK